MNCLLRPPRDEREMRLEEKLFVALLASSSSKIL